MWEEGEGVGRGRILDGGEMLFRAQCIDHHHQPFGSRRPQCVRVAYLGLGTLEVLLGLFSTNSDPPHN